MIEDKVDKTMYIYATEFTKNSCTLAYDYRPPLVQGNLTIRGGAMSPLELSYVAQGMTKEQGYKVILDYDTRGNFNPIPSHMRKLFLDFVNETI